MDSFPTGTLDIDPTSGVLLTQIRRGTPISTQLLNKLRKKHQDDHSVFDIIMSTITSPKGTTYTYEVVPQSRVDYARFMDPSSKYTRNYFQVNVCDSQGKMLNFGFIDNIDNHEDVLKVAQDVVHQIENPEPDYMSSRWD